MKILLGLMALFLCVSAMAETVIISWEPTGDEIAGYRVYQYNPDKKLVYEGLETSYRQEQFEPTVFAVSQFTKDGLESEVVPRAVFIQPRRPTTIKFTVELE